MSDLNLRCYWSYSWWALRPMVWFCLSNVFLFLFSLIFCSVLSFFSLFLFCLLFIGIFLWQVWQFCLHHYSVLTVERLGQAPHLYQGRVCSHNSMCCQTEMKVADPAFCLTQMHYTNTWPTSSSSNPTKPGVWHGRHFIGRFLQLFRVVGSFSCLGLWVPSAV